jgi:hypothetical protein
MVVLIRSAVLALALSQFERSEVLHLMVHQLADTPIITSGSSLCSPGEWYMQQQVDMQWALVNDR